MRKALDDSVTMGLPNCGSEAALPLTSELQLTCRLGAGLQVPAALEDRAACQ